MLQEDIDYSNTLFYKISCKDISVKDLYVGHTTNFVQRKNAHKRACTSEKDANYNVKVYKTIRTNGGWDNWNMEIIGYKNCENLSEARMVEQSYYESLKANLNSIPPMRNKTIIARTALPTSDKDRYCNKCKVHFETDYQLNQHLNTKKHKNNSNNPDDDSNKAFNCTICNYKCNKKSDYDKHLKTRRHTQMTDSNKKPKKSYLCIHCNKEYKYSSGLSKHRKTCQKKTTINETEDTNDKEIVSSMIERQIKLEKQLEEQKIQINNVLQKLEVLTTIVSQTRRS